MLTVLIIAIVGFLLLGALTSVLKDATKGVGAKLDAKTAEVEAKIAAQNAKK